MGGRFDHELDEDSTTTPSPENTAESPVSGDEAAEEAYAPTRKKRRGAHKRVVTVPIRDGDGYRSKSEVYPPPDSWSWRKYGQKPIKGSPYPRGYYKCSSSKGCPARKQVERSHLDPTTLLITYAAEHNHPQPTAATKNHHNHNHNHNPPSPAAAKSATTSSSSDTTTSPPATFSDQPDIEPEFTELAGEFGWLCNIGSTVMDGMTFVGPMWGSHADVESSVLIREEDELLFGDLGDLPESSLVFPRYRVETPCYGGTG